MLVLWENVSSIEEFGKLYREYLLREDVNST